MSKSIVIVEDHSVLRQLLKESLDKKKRFNVIGDFNNGQDAVKFCESNNPDIIIMDIHMPILDGISATEQIISQNPDQKIIMLTLSNSDISIQRSIEAGAKAFLSKEIEFKELINAIDTVIDKGYFYTPHVSSVMASALVKKNNSQTNVAVFTSRELEILELICAEKTNEEISRHIHISRRTVQNHVQNILRKAGAKNVVGLMIYAHKNKLVEL